MKKSVLLFALSILILSIPVSAQSVTGLVPGAAPAGARVLVIGDGLGNPDLSVLFPGSGTPAQVVSRAAPAIEVVVPLSATTGEV